jgi:hypothetical protein
VSQFLGLEDDPAGQRLTLQFGTPEGRVVDLACSYRCAHPIAAALGRWQSIHLEVQSSRKTAILAAEPGVLPCCP